MSGLTVLVSGVTMGKGISKKSGQPKPYAFAQVHYLVPAKSFLNDDNNINKLGLEEKTISMSENASLFAKFGELTFPTQLKLSLDADPENPSRNIVVDYAKA
ncbi:hypothetical protein Q4491_04390 [Photobacterium sp. 2_MG-2023]|uniref:Uncharacterized protein n=2 Tax=Photobacterium TaxID=657 RepID=A0A7X4W985_9GAMM|nr:MULTISPECIES: hypothetical protein [Photobacterium]MBD8514472.1 hypothetical protein [Photobacterium arenosum]MDO6580576.1 hypothetical protein [Photobacterium sp. 2_MG-2023]NAW64539.1 hypothetical protein [Photobacterium halotolerans]